MPDDSTNHDLSDVIRDRLESLAKILLVDTASLHAYPHGQAVFRELFDAIQSTLQNTDDIPADTL